MLDTGDTNVVLALRKFRPMSEWPESLRSETVGKQGSHSVMEADVMAPGCSEFCFSGHRLECQIKSLHSGDL
jgi:hypothetical protein